MDNRESLGLVEQSAENMYVYPAHFTGKLLVREHGKGELSFLYWLVNGNQDVQEGHFNPLNLTELILA